jgi:hypothetical protein
MGGLHGAASKVPFGSSMGSDVIPDTVGPTDQKSSAEVAQPIGTKDT